MPKDSLIGKIVSLRAYDALYWVLVLSVDGDGLRGTYVLRKSYYSDGTSYRVKLKDYRRELNAGVAIGRFTPFKVVRVLKRKKL